MSFDAATRARLVGLFVAEGEETAVGLGRVAEALRRTVDEDALSEFGRLAHGLKGAAASLGFERLATALHDLEDLALGLRGADAAAAADRHARVAAAVEALAEGLARMAAGGGDAFPADVAARMAAVVGARSALPPTADRRSLSATAGEGEHRDPLPLSPSAREGQGEGAAPRPHAELDRLSVPAGEVDAALRLASSLARGAAQLKDALGPDGALSAPAHALARSARELEGIVAALRLVPADAALSGLEDEVLELAARLGKRVAARVEGRDVRADRRTLQAARGLVRHLVRNAVDHGIEAPADRRAAGKPDAGTLTVRVLAGESALRIAVEDDGAGFDVAAIRAGLAARGEDPARLAAASDDDVLQRFAAEGGSTRDRATEVSGRGLGLSAVAAIARAAGGGLRVRSARGEGSAVDVTLPLDVYAVEVLCVVAAGRHHGIPLAAIERTVHLPAEAAAVHDGPAGRTLAVGETILPLVRLADALGRPSAGAADRFAVVVRADAGAAALAVDDVGTVAGVVPAVVPGVAQADALATGLGRLGDGTVVSILNPRLLVAGAARVRPAPRPGPPARPAEPSPERGPLDVVLAEDSLATREVLRVLLEEQGFRVRVAGDGEEALARLEERLPDVLVSDVNMPRRDGLALAREVRRRPASARLPIVLLTSRDDEATRAAGAAAGADAYLVKSRFDAGALREALARIGVRPP